MKRLGGRLYRGPRGRVGWTAPNEEQFRFHNRADTRARRLICAAAGFTRPCCRGRWIRRCATTSSGPRFADVWCAIPKVVLQPHARQRSGQRPARRAVGGPGGRCGAPTRPTGTSRSAAPAWPRQRFELGLVERAGALFPNPVVVGGGTPFLPAGHRRRSARPGGDQDVRARG